MKQTAEEKQELIERVRKDLSAATITGEGEKAQNRIENAAELFAKVIIDNTEGGRDQSLALTHVEDAASRAFTAARSL